MDSRYSLSCSNYSSRMSGRAKKEVFMNFLKKYEFTRFDACITKICHKIEKFRIQYNRYHASGQWYKFL